MDAIETGHARRFAQVGGLPPGVHRRAQDVPQERPGVPGVGGKGPVPYVANPAHSVVTERVEVAKIDVAVYGQRRDFFDCLFALNELRAQLVDLLLQALLLFGGGLVGQARRFFLGQGGAAEADHGDEEEGQA